MAIVRKILVAEDEKALITPLALKLESAGFVVIKAGSGNEAMEKLISEKPDLLLLDLLMPGLDGFGVLEEIKKKGIKVKTVVLSSLAQDEDIKKVKDLGAFDYWVKSDLTLSEVSDRIADLCGS